MIERMHIKILGLLFVVCLCLAGCETPEQDGQPGDHVKLPQKEQLAEAPKSEEKPEGTTSVAASGPLQVRLETAEGDIVIELDRKAAPITVANFVRYVDEGFYDGTIFHRVIPGFMIQGGGLRPDMSEKPTHAPIKNEAANGLKNIRGTITMARTPQPHSATSQFFINHGDNAMLDYGSPRDPNGYAVFGKVVKGMSVVDAIAVGATVARSARNREKSLPVKPVLVKKATVISGE